MRWVVLLVAAVISLRLVCAQDFEELNSVLKDALIYLGDIQASDGLILDLSIKNARCTNWSVGNMNISSQLVEDRILVSLSIDDLDMDCFLDYDYRTLLFSGSGGAFAESRGNDASTQFWVTGNPPVTAELETCAATIVLTNLQFDGGILALAPVEDLIARVITNQAQSTICQQLSEMSTTDLTNLLHSAKETLDAYPPDLQVDPLLSERELEAPHPKLLNLRTKETRVGELFQFALEEMFAFLAQEVENPNGASPTTIDMQANVLLRDLVLDERRAFVLNVQDIFPDGVLWQNEDKLTDTAITLNSIQLFGLDTLTVFQPFQAIGNNTLQNEVAWEYLSFELNATIEIKASRAPDSVIVNPGSTSVVEHITINFGVKNITAIASLLLAVDQEKLESLQLGSLLKSEDLVTCVISTIHKIEFSGLQVLVDNIQEPTLEGFVSSGIDRICTDAAKVAFQMYKPALLKSAPAFFQIAVRNAINKRIQVGRKDCPKSKDESFTKFIDFRDLVLKPQAAADAGGSGTAPYGDTMSIIHSQRFIASGDDGLPKINTAIRPATKAQSGVEGELHFLEPYTLFLYNASRFMSLVKHVEIQSTSCKISNLDTVAPPFQLFFPAGAHNLTNSIYLGRPLTLSSNLRFHIDGDDSPLAVDNLLNLTISFQSGIAFDILATVLEQQFLEFPIKDVANVNCWLATLPVPEIDSQGNVLDSEYIGLQLSRLDFGIEDLDFNVSCISCTSSGGEVLPEILAAFNGAVDIIQERVQRLLNELALGYWDSMEIYRYIAESHKTCPHSPHYDESWNSSLEWPRQPSLSRDAVESIVVLTVLATNFGLVLTAKSHLLRPVELTDPLSGEQQLSEEGQLVDWNDLSSSVGEWAVSAYEEMRSFAGEVSEDKVTGEMDLGANLYVRDFFENGIFEVNLNGFDFESGGTDSIFGRMRIVGLDSMLEANILDVTGSRTLSNRVRFEALRLEVDIEMNFETTETATFAFQLNNVDVDSALLLAVDWHELGGMKVGSILQLKRILPCLVSKFHAVEITQLLVTAESMDMLRVDGFLSGSVSSSLLETSRQFLSNFTNDLIASIPKLCDITIRKVLNSMLVEFLENEEEYCSYDSEVSLNGTIDFRDLFLSAEMARSLGGSGDSPYGDTFRILFQALQEQISAVDEKNQTMLNEMFVRPLTFEQSNVNGSLIYPGEAFNASGTVRLSNWDVSLECKVTNARIENLDTVGEPLNLLQPVLGQSSVLNNSLSMGVGPKPLRLAATVYLALSDDNEMNIQNEVEVSLDVSAITFVLTVFLAMSESAFFALPLRSLQDINCWLSSISADSFDTNPDAASLFHYGILVEKANLNISCISCGSPKFSKLVQQLYSPGETQEEVDSFVAGAEGLMDRFLGSGFLQNIAREIVSDAAKVCPDSPDYDANATTGDFWVQPETYIGLGATKREAEMNQFNVANAIVAAVLLISTVIARFVIRRNNRKWLQSLPDDQVNLLHRQDQIEAEREKYLNQHTDSMFRSELFPRRIRYAVPVVLLLNIGMFLVGHIAVLSYVNIEAQIAGDPFSVERFIEFRFFKISSQTYRNGGSEMAIFLIVFSGVWPYIKLLAAMVLWFVPPNRLSVARRGKLFLWMDVLTKLSIIDILTMLFAIAVLLVYIGGPGQEFYNSGELYAMTLVVVPQAGFYCIVIGQRLNRVSSRFFLDHHDKIVTVASAEYRRLHQHQQTLTDEENIFESNTSMSTSPSYSEANSESFEECTGNSLESPSRIPSNRQEWGMVENDLMEEVPPENVTLYDSTPGPRTPDPPRPVMPTLVCPIPEPPPPLPPSSELPTTDSLTSRLMCKCFQGQHMMGGTVAVVFAGVFVLILFIIGCTLAPSLSLNVDEVLSFSLESGTTFADAVNEFSVFEVVSRVLLKTRFVLSSTADYVGLGILLCIAGLSMVIFPAVQSWNKFQEWRANCKQSKLTTGRRNRRRRKSVILGFTNRLKVWNHMEVFVIAFCIASWQLCAVVAYVIHNYCDLLERFYEALAYVGLVEQTTSNCFGIQASDPLTLLLLIGSFFLLLASFVMQMLGQYRKNKAHIEELLNEESRPVASF